MFNSSSSLEHSLMPSQIEYTVQQLVEESMANLWGDGSPATYDTSCVLHLVPALQPKGCLDLILSNQNDDSSWGGASAYCIVPSLAATASLL